MLTYEDFTVDWKLNMCMIIICSLFVSELSDKAYQLHRT